ncbi:ArsR family transcriptional regulator [bacterium]|nr:ArsR family transcriptional regulator [bacterium]
MIMPAVRMSPEQAYQNVKAGQAILVCAYDDEATFQKMRLDMAISFGEFRRRLPSLPKDQEIIFYCA